MPSVHQCEIQFDGALHAVMYSGTPRHLRGYPVGEGRLIWSATNQLRLHIEAVMRQFVFHRKRYG